MGMTQWRGTSGQAAWIWDEGGPSGISKTELDITCGLCYDVRNRSKEEGTDERQLQGTA